MEMLVEVRFTPTINMEVFDGAFRAMKELVRGAAIEEKFDVFEEPVPKMLQRLLDRYYEYFFNVEGFKRKGDQFLVSYVTGFEGREFLCELLEFLIQCGCTKVSGKAYSDGYSVVCSYRDGEILCREERN